MPAPRANYECVQCAKVAGQPDGIMLYEDLPITSTRCPVCGWRRGFRRRYDAINVSTVGHYVAQRLDKVMEPQFAEAARIRDAAKTSEKQLVEDHARAVEVVPEAQRPQMREALAKGPVRWLPGAEAKMALGGLSPAARSDSQRYIWPAIKHRVVGHRGD